MKPDCNAVQKNPPFRARGETAWGMGLVGLESSDMCPVNDILPWGTYCKLDLWNIVSASSGFAP